MTAFSNGFEFDAWNPNWCGRCVKDGMGTGPQEAMCPVLSGVMINNKVPKEWIPGTDDLRDRYHCTEFDRGY